MRINYLYSLEHLRIDNPYPLYQLTNRSLNKALSLPSDIACKLHGTDWFEQTFLLPQYQQHLDQHKEQLPQLDPGELEIVEKLEDTGVCLTSLEALNIPNTRSLLDAAKEITDELAQQSRTPEYDHKHTLMATAEHLMTHPEIFY